MMSTNNIFSPANGQPIISPSQDIVMGCYYLTAARSSDPLTAPAGGARYEPAGTLKALRFEVADPCEAGEGMVFNSPAEVFLAFQQKKVGTHARIRVRQPVDKKVMVESKDKGKLEELDRNPNAPGGNTSGLVSTTVGRVLFNDILHPKMAYYDVAMGSKYLARVISDCYQLLGRRETIDLLDRMKDLGFRESTRSGLSFATDDLRTPHNKERVLRETEKRVDWYRKQYDLGNITEQERYNNVIDLWTHARDQITQQMMADLKEDRRPDESGEVRPYLNPIFLMAHSGARGGVEQIRQLAGMRGLMAKPNGTIIETPIRANFREGLSVLEYFSSTHGARKGLADTALKTADSGYLTRKLADVAQNVVITLHDCGTTQGVSKQAQLKGEEIERTLSESIRGRVSRNTIRHPVTDKEIVAENEMISWEQARKLEELGIDKILVRSPMTCQAPLGVCRLCYGMDLATGSMVEEGMAVGIIAAQSIGEPGTQLTMRTFHIGGVVKHIVEDNVAKTRKGGIVKIVNVTVAPVDKGDGKPDRVALTRNGEIQVCDAKGRPQEVFPVRNGSLLMVDDGQQVAPGATLASWDAHNTPIVADRGGRIAFDDIVEGQTLRKERDAATGAERWEIMEHKGDLHPMINIEDDRGQILMSYYMPEKAFLLVREGQKVSAGTYLAKTPLEVVSTQDITGGLPRVTEIFEARRPREPAVMAEVAGLVRLGDKRRGKRTIYVRPVDPETGHPVPESSETEHLVPPGKHLRVHTNDRVKEGDPLVFGPLVPHDILRISGIDAVQNYLVREVQSVYRSQRVDIDDKHIEIIVSQMLRKVKVEKQGDTRLLPGSIIDRFRFNEVNAELRRSVKVQESGGSKFKPGDIIAREVFEEERARLEAEGREMPTWTEPEPSTNSTQLLGITKAAVQSDSFISAASFQETTKVLTEAALAGKVDYLVGLKENVILGHLVPAGTGFRMHQDAEVRLNTPDGEAHEPEPRPDGVVEPAIAGETATASS
jgi:DNA-directed RNA polymerase subunit beta'